MVSDFQNQINGFLLSVFFGVFLGAVYDILRVIRKITLPKNSIVFIMDFLFWSFCSLVTFIAAFSTNYGVLRAYHILGEGLGGVIYFATIGRITFFILEKILLVLGKTEAFYKNYYERMKHFFISKKKTKKCRKKGAKSLKKNK